jgi:diguanylate cyclase (GGDEF)-like protein
MNNTSKFEYKNELHNRLIFENNISAIAIHEMIFNSKGKPIDYTFLSVNPAFEKQTGLKAKDILGKRITKVLQGIEKTTFIKTYGDVVKTGKTITFESYSEPLKQYYSVNAFKLLGNTFAVTFNNITVEKKAFADIKTISYKDDLTKLYNRRFFNKEMKRLDTRTQLPLSIIVADMNGLKLINDTYGHKVGDEVLKYAAKILRDACRKNDTISRCGGDEFSIILPRTSKKVGEQIIKRIEDLCIKRTKVHKGIKLPISISLGSATKTRSEEKIKDLFQVAEDKMYANKLTQKSSIRNLIIQSLIKTLTAKGFEESHMSNMAKVGKIFGEKLGFDSHRVHQLETLINLHDIGKVNVPEEILITPKKLSPEDFRLVKKHTSMGYRITRDIENLSHFSEDILSHHERWDGNGYPRKLKGHKIPYNARLITIIDSYEVMKHGRPYKKALSKKDIINEFKKEAGKQFDPELTKVFVSLLEEDAF